MVIGYMKGEKVFVIIFSIINALLLILSIVIIMMNPNNNFYNGVGLFLLIWPLIIGCFTFIVTKYVKKFDIWRALKYTNIIYFAAYIIPLLFFIIIGILYPPRSIAMYGIKPLYGVSM